MKTNVCILLIIGVVSIFVGGCEKDSIIDENQTIVDDNALSDEERPESLGEYVPSDDEFFIENVVNLTEKELQKSSNDDMLNIINNAISPFAIPNYNFRCYDNYKWAYQHVKQPDKHSCSWSSYVICTGNIAAVCGKNYPVSEDQVYVVKDGCGESQDITVIRDYANDVDRKFVKAKSISLKKNKTDYLDVFKEMMLLLYVNRTPFITISMSGKYTHYVTVYSVYWKQGIVGSKIYFTDTLDPDRGSFNKNVKYMDLWDFYCSMKKNSNKCYNFLELRPR